MKLFQKIIIYNKNTGTILKGSYAKDKICSTFRYFEQGLTYYDLLGKNTN